MPRTLQDIGSLLVLASGSGGHGLEALFYVLGVALVLMVAAVALPTPRHAALRGALLPDAGDGRERRPGRRDSPERQALTSVGLVSSTSRLGSGVQAGPAAKAREALLQELLQPAGADGDHLEG